MARKGPTQFTRRSRGPEQAGALLRKQIRSVGESRGFAVSRVLTHWEEIVGPDFARATRPIEINYGRGFGATLTVLVSGANAPMVEMQKERIREKVNACYGYAAISRVRLTQTAPVGFGEVQADYHADPAPPSPRAVEHARAATETISDETLRAALESLGARVMSDKKNA